MPRSLRLRLSFAFSVFNCHCETEMDDVDGFKIENLSEDDIYLILLNAVLPWYRRLFCNPIYRKPYLWTLANVVRMIVRDKMIDADCFDLSSDVCGVVASVRFELGYPISFGRFCALCAWCVHFCDRESLEESEQRCREVSVALKRCLA